MTEFDIFNGDADGLCAAQQWRLAYPAPSHLITGVKRTIALVKTVPAQAGDHCTVFDLSFDVNRSAVQDLLTRQVHIDYFDHHYAGDILQHPNLKTTISQQPMQGTSWLVDQHLTGRYRRWAIVGTFGDNFDETADELAASESLTASQRETLKTLGMLLNYNGYGTTVADLHIAPDVLLQRMRPFSDPFAFIAADPAFEMLQQGYEHDLQQARQITPDYLNETVGIWILPPHAWARRVSGVYANQLARNHPERAHALLTPITDDCFVVSVRAPLARPYGADELCRQFATGGGRVAAAGINQLPATEYTAFVKAITAHFSKEQGSA
jgi:hypothetical protein